VKLSLLDEDDVDELHEGLVGAITMDYEKIHQLYHMICLCCKF
jgi:hypothetical protein